MVERMLERLQDDVSATREQLAELVGKFDAFERLANRVEALDRSTNAHIAEDAETHGKLAADVHRLWWGTGAVITSLVGALITAVARAVGGAD